MLVLSRKLGQRFQLGQDVRITIVRIDRHNVRIGIEAPANLDIQREEITDSEMVVKATAPIRGFLRKRA